MGGNSGEMCVIHNTFTSWFSLSHELQTLSLWDIQHEFGNDRDILHLDRCVALEWVDCCAFA